MTTSDNTRRILIIDDNESIHDDFCKVLLGTRADTSSLDETEAALFGCEIPKSVSRPTFEVDSAYQGQEGLELVKKALAEQRPYALAFVDVRMPPGWDGVETIERIWQVDPEIQTSLCTAFSDYSIGDILERLGISDRLVFLKKPFDVAEANLLAIALSEKWHVTREMNSMLSSQSDYIADANRVRAVIETCHLELKHAHADLQGQANELAQRLQQRTVEMLGTRDVTVFALAKLAESRDPETGEHLERMRAYSQILAEQLSLEGPYTDEIDGEFLENFYLSTPLHDIGKVGIPDGILLKPGKLTKTEFETMKEHTIIGAEALESAARHSSYGGFLRMAAQIARFHHERFDGGGYPEGLVGLQIPLAARIVAVADVFDALASRRVYKDAMSPGEAQEIIEKEDGKHFDPAVVEAFRYRLDEILQTRSRICQDSTDLAALA